MNNPNYKKLQAEDDGVINLLGLRVSKLERENRGLRATVSRLRKTDLAKENERLRSRVQELEELHWLDQSEIVRLRRTVGILDGEWEMAVLDKKQYLKELETKLGEFLPASEIQQILTAAGETLNNYDVQYTKTKDGDSDSEDLLKYFIEAKRVEGRSEKTIEQYTGIIRMLKEAENVPFTRMTVYNIRSYLSAEEKRGVAASTRENRRQVLSSFFGWLSREGLIDKNPILNVAPVKQKKVKRKPFSNREIAKLRRAALNPNDSRNMAIILFFASTGCRVGEVCKLNRDDIDMKEQSVTVLGKGDKERTVLFDDDAALYLSSYLSEREDDEEALFLGKFNERMTPGGMRYMMRQLGKKAGVTNVHPHRFRRTRATSLIDHGMQIQNVSHLLGHEKIDTTMKYVYIDEQNVATDYRKYA